MKKILVILLILLLSAAIMLPVTGCSRETDRPDFGGYTPGIIYVDYVHGYESLAELAVDADLIVAGTIDRTLETVPDEATKDKQDPRSWMWQTRSAFKVEKSVKGDCPEEIIVSQEGAVGWAQEEGNPVFQPGEGCFLFLKKGENDIYWLLHPDGRFRIEDNSVYSLNFVLQTGEARPPLDLRFWNINTDKFCSKVIEAIKEELIIPNEEPVIVMQLSYMMQGSQQEIRVFKDGSVLHILEKGLRFPSPGHPAVRIWKTGNISPEGYGEVRSFIDSAGFLALDEHYQVPGTEQVTSDLHFTISVKGESTGKTVTASGYFTPDTDYRMNLLPPPLDEIYLKLIGIAENETKELYREQISG